MREAYIREMTWSYSRLKSFENCPYGWYLKYIEGVEPQPQFYSSYGKYIHEILAEYYTGKLEKRDLVTRFLFGFPAGVEGERPSAEIVINYIEKGKKFFENFEPFPYKTLMVEDDKRFDYFGIPFRGIIDYAGELDGEIYLIDFKSRELKPRSNRKTPTQLDRDLDDMLRQLYIYSERIKLQFGKYPSYLCFCCFKNGVFIKEPFQEAAFLETVDWVKRTVADIEAEKEFIPDLEYFKCRYLCDSSAECCYYEMR